MAANPRQPVEHSPLPWKVGDFTVDGILIDSVPMEAERHHDWQDLSVVSVWDRAHGQPSIAECDLHTYEADAAFIVRAVNNHDALVDAVKSASEWLAALSMMDSFNGQQELIAKLAAAATGASR